MPHPVVIATEALQPPRNRTHGNKNPGQLCGGRWTVWLWRRCSEWRPFLPTSLRKLMVSDGTSPHFRGEGGLKYTCIHTFTSFLPVSGAVVLPLCVDIFHLCRAPHAFPSQPTHCSVCIYSSLLLLRWQTDPSVFHGEDLFPQPLIPVQTSPSFIFRARFPKRIIYICLSLLLHISPSNHYSQDASSSTD